MNGTGGIWTVRTTDGARTRRRCAGGSSRRGPTSSPWATTCRLEEEDRGGSWVIAEIYPRRSRLARRAPGGAHGERVVVANIDQVIVVFAFAKPEPHPRMLDRFLVIAAANDIHGAHRDQQARAGRLHRRARLDEYELAGYPIHFTSVKERIGLEELGEALPGARRR